MLGVSPLQALSELWCPWEILGTADISVVFAAP